MLRNLYISFFLHNIVASSAVTGAPQIRTRMGHTVRQGRRTFHGQDSQVLFFTSFLAPGGDFLWRRSWVTLIFPAIFLVGSRDTHCRAGHPCLAWKSFAAVNFVAANMVVLFSRTGRPLQGGRLPSTTLLRCVPHHAYVGHVEEGGDLFETIVEREGRTGEDDSGLAAHLTEISVTTSSWYSGRRYEHTRAYVVSRCGRQTLLCFPNRKICPHPKYQKRAD